MNSEDVDGGEVKKRNDGLKTAVIMKYQSETGTGLVELCQR